MVPENPPPLTFTIPSSPKKFSLKTIAVPTFWQRVLPVDKYSEVL